MMIVRMLVCLIALVSVAQADSFEATGRYAHIELASADTQYQPTGRYAAPSPSVRSSLSDLQLPVDLEKKIMSPAPAPALVPVAVPDPLPPKPRTSIPQKKSYMSYTPWYENGGNTSDAHLLQHGATKSMLQGLTSDQKNHLHGVYHAKGELASAKPIVRSVAKPVVRSSPCPNGRCPYRR